MVTKFISDSLKASGCLLETGSTYRKNKPVFTEGISLVTLAKVLLKTETETELPSLGAEEDTEIQVMELASQKTDQHFKEKELASFLKRGPWEEEEAFPAFQGVLPCHTTVLIAAAPHCCAGGPRPRPEGWSGEVPLLALSSLVFPCVFPQNFMIQT